jgi:hypothetical protein
MLSSRFEAGSTASSTRSFGLVAVPPLARRISTSVIHMTAFQLPSLRTTGLVGAAMLATGSLGLAQNPNSGATSTAQELTSELFCTEIVDEGEEAFLVTAKATLGPPQTLKFNVCFVIDISTTMGQTDLVNPVGDANGDGQPNTRLDAAILGLEALSASLAGTPNIDFSLVAFAKDAAILDLGPGAGQQQWISDLSTDADGINGPDFSEVLRSLDTGALGVTNVAKFTSYDWDAGTDYTESLIRMNQAFATQPAGEINIAFFISDGLPNQPPAFDAPGGPLAQAIANGIVINAFGVGPDVATICDPGQPLDKIATGTGGNCFAVTDPGTLQAVLQQAGATDISKVELCVNGNLVATVLGPDPDMLQITNFDVFPFLQLGVNLLEAKAYAADGTVVTASKDVDKTACLLMVGLFPRHQSLGGTDYLYVDHLFWVNVTEAQVPTFTIPNLPSLVGMDVFMQVGMHNVHAFPTNAVQMSNGLRVRIGDQWSVFGGPSGIWAWVEGSVQPGGSFKARFDVLAM